jgi:HK97 family phage major capsid protein
VREVINQNRSELLAKARAILEVKPYSKQSEATFMSIMKLVDAYDAETRHRQADVTLAEIRKETETTKAAKAAMEFRHYLACPSEKRTYSAMGENTLGGGGYFVPTEWLKTYQAKLASASGWLKAGAQIVSSQTIVGRPYVDFLTDDISNEAEILDENASFNPANPTFATAMPTVKRFASSSLLSTELWQDSAFDLEQYLQTTFAVRVARKFNNFASVDGTYGLLSQLTVGATAASSTVPTLAELVNMQTAIDYAYREDGAVYMLSPTMEAVLKQQVGTSGNKLYPEMNDGDLLGYDYVVNVDQPYAAANVGVVFGSIKRAVLVQSVTPGLVRSAERYAEFSKIFIGYVHRLGVKLADSTAVTALKLHA